MEEKQYYDAQFQEILSNLNKAQTQAVEQIEGPVLVVAGPGTGKTQILSARIGNILKKTDTLPHNILCLTYTEAGTVAMRKRLNDFIGPDSYNVHIFTFHGFCNKIIQENLDYFGVRELQPLSDIEEVEILQELIDGFDKNHPLKRFTGDEYFERGRLKSLFSTMKQENWSEEFIIQKTKEYLDDLPNREKFQYKRKYKEFNAGDLKQKLFDEEKVKCETLIAAVGEFKSYIALLSKYGRYDYNDMIVWVLEALQKNEFMRLRYQEQYLYFLVDEYQDTNGSQNKILELMSSYWEVPNVFVVGDDDQSIYRFQGANIKNIKDFYDRNEANIQQIVLTENYRSSQPILDIAKHSIEHNEDRLVNVVDGLTKELTASGSLKTETLKPQLIECTNALHEELMIIKKVEELQAQGEDLSQVAIIYRNHKNVERLVKIFEEQSIPMNIKKRVNILDLPLIQNLLNVFKYICEEQMRPDQGEPVLFQLMHFEPFGVAQRDILKVARLCQRSAGPRWRDVISNKQKMFAEGFESIGAIASLEANLSFWIKESSNYTLQVLFEKILTRGKILEYVMNSPERMWHMQVITTFFDFIKAETTRKPKMNIEEFLEVVKKHERYNLALPVNKIYHSESGVNFVTAHSSKGLEFKYVFLIGCNAGNWESSNGRLSGYKLPDTIVATVEENKEEEERRLFYVALTRAEQHLYISYNAETEDGKEIIASKFIAEIKDHPQLTFNQVSFSNEEILEYYFNILKNEDKPSLPLVDEDLIIDRLKNFKMSVTALNKYLRCPITFYFESIVKVPTARNVSMGFGSVVHYALENYFKEMLADSHKNFPGEKRMLELYKKGMDIYRSHFTDREYASRLEYAELILPKYLNKYQHTWQKVTALEYDINHVQHQGVPLSGKLDKIEFDGNNVNVVDYKTGNPDYGTKKLNPPTEKDPNGGDYWRQMVFYKILMDADKRKDWNMVSAEMDFIQQDNKDEFIKRRVHVTPQDVDIVSKQITDSYTKIMNHEFSEGCGDKDCTWCNFVKSNFKSEELDFSEVTLEDE